MGAGASIPEELTLEESRAIAGARWDEKLVTFWPEGEEKISKARLIDICNNIPMFSKRPTVSDQLNVRAGESSYRAQALH
jgi:hypothetical protein